MMHKRPDTGPGSGFARGGEDGVERELGRLDPGTVPPGLRERVLDRAARARRSAVLTPALRLAAAACAVLIAMLLLADPFVGRREAARLQALLDGRPEATLPIRSDQELAEILGAGNLDTERLTRLELRAAAAARLEREHRLADARRRLKGWLGNEAAEDLI